MAESNANVNKKLTDAAGTVHGAIKGSLTALDKKMREGDRDAAKAIGSAESDLACLDRIIKRINKGTYN